MKHARFGCLDVPVAVVGQGTWNLEHVAERQAIDALVAGIDAGMTHIDTAELYGNGRVERIVGKAITGRRESVFLVSKVLPSNASYDGTIAACERSLSRLGTDHLDVYLLHWPGNHPLEDTLRAFIHLQEQGKVHAFGVSNFDVDDLEQARAIVGERRLVCDQVLYHLEERSIEHRVVPWCEENDLAVVAYSPFGSGSFPSSASRGGQALAAVADAHEASPYQVALAFLIQRGNAFVIPKAATLEHVRENAAAADLVLDDEDIQALDAAFPAGWRYTLAMI
jgi:diketogulonate reductase-like aldo/keto reductase